MGNMFAADIGKYVKTLSEEEGFSDFGWVNAAALDEDFRRLSSYVEDGFNADMKYLAENMEKRLDPRTLVEGACSVMVFLAQYPHTARNAGENTIKIASYAMGQDYHFVIRSRLERIMKKISAEFPEFMGRAFTDSAPVMERAWAVRAGLGFIGKNNMLVSRKCGNRTFIATIISNMPVPENRKGEILPVSSSCLNCNRCIESCPTGALSPYMLDSRKCISYQTIESRRSAECEDFLINRHGWIFGCDECVSACPWYNIDRNGGWSEFSVNRDFLISLDAASWMNMTGSEFRRKFSGTPFSRAGIKKMKDNVKNRGTNDR